jgi:hypothetical protein
MVEAGTIMVPSQRCSRGKCNKGQSTKRDAYENKRVSRHNNLPEYNGPLRRPCLRHEAAAAAVVINAARRGAWPIQLYY